MLQNHGHVPVKHSVLNHAWLTKAIDRKMMTGSNTVFIPELTVMAEYGGAPFLRVVRNLESEGVGGNLCDGTFWDESFPMSERLWCKFADWAFEFDGTEFYPNSFDDSNWDWIDYNARGLQLSHLLKREVGDKYRVFYLKPHEDPNHRINQRSEILADGTLVPSPPLQGSFPEPIRFLEFIVSGGQSGADRAALDFAIMHRYSHGGWAPRGRMAEDGPIPLKYQLNELANGGYRQRTRRNVHDSDGTLIVNLGELDGGTLVTQTFAQEMGKPSLVIQLDSGVSADTSAPRPRVAAGELDQDLECRRSTAEQAARHIPDDHVTA